jgi:hypothetical protein
MTPYETGNPDSARKVLIAGERSEFKEQVVVGLIEKLGTEDWYYRVIGLNQLAEQDTEAFGAVLLVAAVRAGKLSGQVTDFLSSNPANPKVILFYTRGSEEPMPEKSRPKLKVDAVSSASKADRVDMRAEELAVLLEQRF